MGKVFSLGSGRMVCLDVPSNGDKNRLPIGQKLLLNGYGDYEYAVIGTRGISESFPQYGMRYEIARIDGGESNVGSVDAYQIQWIADKRDNRIGWYILDGKISADDVIDLVFKMRKLRDAEANARDAAAEEKARLVAIGKALFEKYIPADAVALMVAEQEIDDCDSQSDYFNVKHGEHVILGYSMHDRDVFSEMRKAAVKIPETAHMVKAPKDRDEGKRSSDEHREKYSMGAGYYLKASGKYSSGWAVRKVCKYGNGWGEDMFVSMAKRCVFEGGAK